MDTITQFTMRMDNDLYAQLKESAERNKRSIAKELEYIVEYHFKNISRQKELDTLLHYLSLSLEYQGNKYFEEFREFLKKNETK